MNLGIFMSQETPTPTDHSPVENNVFSHTLLYEKILSPDRFPIPSYDCVLRSQPAQYISNPSTKTDRHQNIHRQFIRWRDFPLFPSNSKVTVTRPLCFSVLSTDFYGIAFGSFICRNINRYYWIFLFRIRPKFVQHLCNCLADNQL